MNLIESNVLLLPLIIHLVMAPIVMVIWRRARGLAMPAAILAPIVSLVVYGIVGYQAMHADAVASLQIPWMASVGLHLDLLLTPLALLMCAIVSGIGTLLFAYTVGYSHDDDRGGYLLACLLAFASAMLGVVTADNVYVLYFFWEMTSLLSFLLVGYKSTSEDAKLAARRAFTITVGGGLCMLVGLIMMVGVTGTTRISEMMAMGSLADHALYLPILIMIALGAFTKSAQFPFHVWLPGAMAAPTPVSTYLHAATMVKAGVYLLALFSPMLAGTVEWQWIVGSVGAFTGAWATWRMFFQDDAKGVVAWSTVAALGLMFALLAVGATTALLLTIIAHACYKATFFMVVGAIDHGTGTRDLRRLGGLGKYMPKTRINAIMAGLSIAGVPITLGFLSKEYILKIMSLMSGWHGAGVTITALGGAYVATFLGLRPFICKAEQEDAICIHMKCQRACGCLLRLLVLPVSLLPWLWVSWDHLLRMQPCRFR